MDEIVFFTLLSAIIIGIASIAVYLLKFRNSNNKSTKEGTVLDGGKNPSGELIGIKDLQVIKEVVNENKSILIYFHSKTCPGCRLLAPEINKLELDYNNQVLFVSYSIDENYEEVKSLAIDFVPTVLILDQEADLVFNVVGVKGGDAERASLTIKSQIDNLLTQTIL